MDDLSVSCCKEQDEKKARRERGRKGESERERERVSADLFVTDV
jgi:hypothetical protein